MKDSKTIQWIKGAYTLISEQGMSSLNVEFLARRLGRSKSSFYHYFGSVEHFQEDLLAYHVQQADEFAKLLHTCEKLKPDVLNLFIQRKEDVFFHKHLRINRGLPVFRDCYEKAYQIVEEGILEQWMKFLDLKTQPFFAKAFLNLIAENFLLRITEEEYSYVWLENYVEEARYLLQQVKLNKENLS